MRRRTLLTRGAATLGVAAGLTGCLGLGIFGGSATPPRRSDVFQEISVTDGNTVVALYEDPYVESRADVDAPTADVSRASLLAGVDLGDLSPVGVARAAKGASGRGRGGYTSAAKTHDGRAKLFGEDDDGDQELWGDWRDNHADEIERYSVSIEEVGIGYLGPEDEFEDNPPSPGPIEWDETTGDVSAGGTARMPMEDEGWYRVGAHLEPANDASHDFGWESVDFRMRDGSIDREWKVSPRL